MSSRWRGQYWQGLETGRLFGESGDRVDPCCLIKGTKRGTGRVWVGN